MGRYLIIGASGNTGLEATKTFVNSGALEKGNHKLRLVNRDSKKLKESLGEIANNTNVEIVSLDISDSSKQAEAFKDVDFVFVAYAFVENAPEVITSLVNAAKAAHVKHFVKLSAVGADANSPLGIGRYHGVTDAAIKSSGMKYTIIRPSFFHVNLFNQSAAIKNGVFVDSTKPENKRAWIDPRDIGAFIGTVLKDIHSHENKEYDINGYSVTDAEIVEYFSKELGKEIKFVSLPQEERSKQLKSYGVPDWMVVHLAELNEIVRNGWAASTNSTFKDVVGRDPIHVKQWIHENIAAFK